MKQNQIITLYFLVWNSQTSWSYWEEEVVGCSYYTVNASSPSLSLTVTLFLFPGISSIFWLQTEIMKFFVFRFLILWWFSVRPSHGGSFQGTISLEARVIWSICVSRSPCITVRPNPQWLRRCQQSQGCEVTSGGKKNMAARHPWMCVAPFPDLTR